MGEAIKWATDGESASGKPHPWSRAARVVERATMVIGLGAAITASVLENSLMPMAFIPLVFKGVAYVAAGITEFAVEKLAAGAETLERLATSREYKKENKKDLPRGMR